MQKTDSALVQAIREYAQSHPDNYKKIAISFDTSEINVKRICKGLRGKDWRLGRKSTNPDHAKFWERVDKRPDGCWIWTGSLTDDGYGNVWFDGKCQGAHCVAYELTFGPIPEGLELDHKCHVRACCNPDHLEPVTHAENMKRVRSLQAKQTRFTACHSAGFTDTGSLIDTGEKAKSKALFNVARPIINEDKINAEAPSKGPVSVSIEPGSSTALNVVAEHEEVDLSRVTHTDDSGEVGDSRPGQASDKKAAEFCIYEISSLGDGIRVKVLARSEYDAEDKFASVWGNEPTVHAEKVTDFVDEDVAAKWLSTQGSELASEFDRWQHSEYGRRHLARVAREAEREREAREAEEARRWEDEIDRETVRRLAEQDYLLARDQRRLSRDARKKPPQLPRYDREPAYRPEYEAYDGEEEHDL
jgi:hypothetical protein